MPSTPMARVGDSVTHPAPPVLTPGPGSFDVSVGFMPAWRGLPSAAAAVLEVAQKISDAVVTVAENAATAASGTPAAPAAKAAELAVKTAAVTALTSLMNGLSAGCAAMTGGGTPDIHMCTTAPPIPPHGPGMVIDGNPTVLVNGLPACQVGDKVLEALGGPNPITMGCQTVIIGEPPASPGMSFIGALLGAVTAAVEAVIEVVETVVEVIVAVVEAVIKEVKKIVATVVGTVVAVAREIARQVVEVVSSLGETLSEAAKAPVKPDLDDVLTDYQVREEDMAEFKPLVFFGPSRMVTETEKDALGQLSLLELNEMSNIADESFAAADRAYPMPDDWRPGETERERRSSWQNYGHNDAFRHTYWNARMADEFGQDWTENFATAHEGVAGNDAAREAQDLYNNEQGRNITRDLTENGDGATDDAIYDRVQEAIDNGDLIVVDQNGDIQWSDDVGVGEHGVNPPTQVLDGNPDREPVAGSDAPAPDS